MSEESQKRALASFARAKKQPAKTTKLDLSNAGFEAFPSEILACKNLVSLELFRAIAPRLVRNERGAVVIEEQHVPDTIGSLKRLAALGLGGLYIHELPETIGDLSALQALSVDYCEHLDALPKSLGRLRNLLVFELTHCGLRELPESIGALTKLEALIASNCALQAMPQALSALVKLQVLHLPASVSRLPKGFSKLVQLRELELSAAALRSIARDLRSLKKLVTLRVVGENDAPLPEELGSLVSLQELDVSFLGLQTLPNSVVRLTKLTTLDVEGNALTELATVATALPKLKVLRFADNPLPAAENDRVSQLMRSPASKRRVLRATGGSRSKRS